MSATQENSSFNERRLRLDACWAGRLFSIRRESAFGEVSGGLAKTAVRNKNTWCSSGWLLGD